jgi:hypothetical protein
VALAAFVIRNVSVNIIVDIRGMSLAVACPLQRGGSDCHCGGQLQLCFNKAIAPFHDVPFMARVDMKEVRIGARVRPPVGCGHRRDPWQQIIKLTHAIRDRERSIAT